MTTASEFVTEALREANLIPFGTVASAPQLAEGLARLNGILVSLFGNEVGEPLAEWPIIPPQRTAPVAARWPLLPGRGTLMPDGSNVWPYPPCNVRLMCSITTDATVFLQYEPNDGARVEYAAVGATAFLTLNGNGRRVDGATEIVIDPTDNGGKHRLFYRSDLGSWVSVSTLTATDTPFLPEEFNDFIICALAIRMASRFGQDPREGTTFTFQKELAKLKARYRQPTNAVVGPTLNSIQAYPQGWGEDLLQ